MFHLILMLCSSSLPACSTFDMPKTYATHELCSAEGTNQVATYLKSMRDFGQGGLKVDGFICIKT
jgi:hypothetical protein